MATPIVKLRDLDVVRLTMEDVGKRLGMAILTLPALMRAVNAQLVSRVMVRTNVKILMNARKGLHASAKNANARTHGEAMSADAVEVCFT